MKYKIRRVFLTLFVVFFTVVPTTATVQAADYGSCAINAIGLNLENNSSGVGWSYERNNLVGTLTLTADQNFGITCNKGADYVLLKIQYEGDVTISGNLTLNIEASIYGNGKEGDKLTITDTLSNNETLLIAQANVEAETFSGNATNVQESNLVVQNFSTDSVSIYYGSTVHSSNTFHVTKSLTVNEGTVILDGQDNTGLQFDTGTFSLTARIEVSHGINKGIYCNSLIIQNDAVVIIDDVAHVGIWTTNGLFINNNAKVHITGGYAEGAIATQNTGISISGKVDVYTEAPIVVASGNLNVILTAGGRVEINADPSKAAIQVLGEAALFDIGSSEIQLPTDGSKGNYDDTPTILNGDGVPANHVILAIHQLDSVTVSPENPIAYKGSFVQFTAALSGLNIVDEEVAWSLEGTPTSNLTSIDENGKLTVGADETASDLRVRATSHSDPGISGLSEVITLQNAAAPVNPSNPGSGSGSGAAGGSSTPLTGVYNQSVLWYWGLLISALSLVLIKRKQNQFD